MAVCLVSVLPGCHKPQTGEVIGAAEAIIKAKALASISAKHPEIGSSDLKFSDLRIEAVPNDSERVLVVYSIPASAKTTTEGTKATTITRTIDVRMSLSGEVENVSDGTRSDVYNVAK